MAWVTVSRLEQHEKWLQQQADTFSRHVRLTAYVDYDVTNLLYYDVTNPLYYDVINPLCYNPLYYDVTNPPL